MNKNLTMISVDALIPHPNNPRKDLGDVSELAESIKATGILQNLTVVPQADDTYMVIIGHRRLAGAKMAGLKEVPCMIADMDEATQLSTMLLENIQRSDLTAYEQAESFQLMLDIGETEDSIAAKTGFSKTTIRKRTNLLSLDKKKFKEAEERGGTLEMYAKLNAIKDNKLRNDVLKNVGTANFEHSLKKAVDTEKSQEKKEAIITKLETFASEYPEETAEELRLTSHTWSSYGDVDIDLILAPDDYKDIGVNYYYKVNNYGGDYWNIHLYTNKPKEIELEVNEEEKQRKEEEQLKREQFGKMAADFYELRKSFFQNLSGLKSKLPILMEYECKQKFHGSSMYVHGKTEKIHEFLGVKASDSTEEKTENEDWEALKSQFSLEKLFLASICVESGDSKNDSYANWQMEYRENKGLDEWYDFLISLGYEMSDEEKTWKNGTHELYEKSTD